MGYQSALIHALNRGIIAEDAIARIDIPEVFLAATVMKNWWPQPLGGMTVRPGLGYIGGIKSNAANRLVPFIAGRSETALLEFTANVMRVWVDDVIVTRPAVSTTISNSTFSGATGWTDASTGAAQLAFGAGLQLQTDAKGSIAECTRQVTVAGGDQNVEHGLKIVVPFGYDDYYIRIGSSAGDDDYIEETRLLAGQHHFGFTPTGDFHITIWAKSDYSVEKRMTSLAIEQNTDVEVVSPWDATAIGKLLWAQSADVIFFACEGVKQYRVERRSARSWSLVEYRSFDGPFFGKTVDLEMEPAATYGRMNVTASQDFFRSAHVGALLRIFHDGQNFTQVIGGEEQWSEPIRVAGVAGTNYSERDFVITTANIGTSTVNVQRSILGEDVGFGNYPRDAGAAATEDITTSTSYNNEDEDGNLIAWYRLGIGNGNYVSGDAVSVSFAYPYGGGFGLVRIVSVTNATTAVVEVLRLLRGTAPTGNWSEGAWSSQQGYPTAVALFQGRLWWVSGAQIWGSVSDDFESFDQENTNYDGPIVRTIGEGPVDNVNFVLPLSGMVLGTDGAELAVRSSGVDEPLSPTSFTLVPISSYGSKANFPAIRLDDFGIFIGGSDTSDSEDEGDQVYIIEPAGTRSGFQTRKLSITVPGLLSAGIVDMAIQRRPDTRLHIILADGTAVILTFDFELENLRSWSTVETGTTGAPGSIERVCVIPTAGEDAVYYSVNRTINGSTVRYLEKYAKLGACIGGTQNKIADSYVVQNAAASTTMSGLSHLEGEEVIVWNDGICEVDGNGDPQTFTVASGAISGLTFGSQKVAGLAYDYRWQSTKLALAARGGNAVGKKKRVLTVNPIMKNTHNKALTFGRDFTTMSLLPRVFDGAAVAADDVWSSYDQPDSPLEGEWDTDARLCIKGNAPFPATVLGVAIDVVTTG